MDPKTVRPETIAAQALGWIDEHTRAITPPIHVSSTYLRDADNQYRSGRVYARADNPAFDQAEAVICALEHGHAAALFASGMAAATAVFQALAPGDHVLAPQVMYWSLRNWLMTFATQWGLEVELIDMTDPAAVRAAIRPGKTKLVWIETPANPLWTVTDIEATVSIAHAAGVRRPTVEDWAAVNARTRVAISRTVCASGPATRNCTGNPTGGPKTKRSTRTRAWDSAPPAMARSRRVLIRSRASVSRARMTICEKLGLGRAGLRPSQKRGEPWPT